MIRVEIELKGLFFAKDKKFMRSILNDLNKKIITSAKFLESELIRNTPVGVTGKLRRDWKTEIEWSTENEVKMVKVTISNPSVYAQVVDEGRRAAPVSKEGRKSLELWAMRKLKVTEKESKTVAFLIARKKANQPTKGKNFVRKTLDDVLPKIISDIEKSFDLSVESSSLVELKPNESELLENNKKFEKGVDEK
jgi:ribosomal protein L18